MKRTGVTCQNSQHYTTVNDFSDNDYYKSVKTLYVCTKVNISREGCAILTRFEVIYGF